jgi:hypothetical protein
MCKCSLNHKLNICYKIKLIFKTHFNLKIEIAVRRRSKNAATYTTNRKDKNKIGGEKGGKGNKVGERFANY